MEPVGGRRPAPPTSDRALSRTTIERVRAKPSFTPKVPSHVYRARFGARTVNLNSSRPPGVINSVESSVKLPEGSSKGAKEPKLKQRKRPGRLFAVTISDFEIYRKVREDFASSFVHLVTYCVAIERSQRSEKVSHHLHAFLEFDCEMLLEDLREYIVSCFPNIKLDLQACRSKKTWLIYISKEDKDVYFNCKSSALHFNYRVHEWAMSAGNFSFLDPFVVQHRFQYRFLQSYLAEYNISRTSSCLLEPVCLAYKNWSLPVATWYNSCFHFTIKRKCLYLYGDSNVGKTTFIERCIGKRNMDCVFYPGVGKFFMQDFNVRYHKVILFEEFDYSLYTECVSLLKRLLEGRPAAFPVKGQADKIINFQGHIIFISNFDLIRDGALRNRLLFVSADVPYWEEESTPVAASIKTEEDDATPGDVSCPIQIEDDDESGYAPSQGVPQEDSTSV